MLNYAYHSSGVTFTATERIDSSKPKDHALTFHRCKPSLSSYLNDTTVYLFCFATPTYRFFTYPVLQNDQFATFLGWDGTPENGVYDTEIRTWPRFLSNVPVPVKFYHPTFRIYCVDKHSNKEISSKTSSSLRYATPVEKNLFQEKESLRPTRSFFPRYPHWR